MGTLQMFRIRLLIIWAYPGSYTTDLLRRVAQEAETNELNLSTEEIVMLQRILLEGRVYSPSYLILSFILFYQWGLWPQVANAIAFHSRLGFCLLWVLFVPMQMWRAKITKSVFICKCIILWKYNYFVHLKLPLIKQVGINQILGCLQMAVIINLSF